MLAGGRGAGYLVAYLSVCFTQVVRIGPVVGRLAFDRPGRQVDDRLLVVLDGYNRRVDRVCGCPPQLNPQTLRPLYRGVVEGLYHEGGRPPHLVLGDGQGNVPTSPDPVVVRIGKQPGQGRNPGRFQAQAGVGIDRGPGGELGGNGNRGPAGVFGDGGLPAGVGAGVDRKVDNGGGGVVVVDGYRGAPRLPEHRGGEPGPFRARLVNGVVDGGEGNRLGPPQGAGRHRHREVVDGVEVGSRRRPVPGNGHRHLRLRSQLGTAGVRELDDQRDGGGLVTLSHRGLAEPQPEPGVLVADGKGGGVDRVAAQ